MSRFSTAGVANAWPSLVTRLRGAGEVIPFLMLIPALGIALLVAALLLAISARFVRA